MCRKQLRLFRGPAVISPGRIFLTTLLNPKALIFAFVIMPPVALDRLWPFILVFWVLVPVCACGWIAVGALLPLAGRGVVTRARIARGAATALIVFAAVIGGSAVASALG